MGTLQFKNNASTTLSGSINNSQTSITVASSAAFPVLTGSDYFWATMYETSGSTEINIEIVKVTATTGNNWTIVRAQDGTTARSRDGIVTCYIELRMTAAGAQLMLQKDNDLSDLASASTARTNLGLGTMATQNSNSVTITGGTISGVTFSTIDSTTTIADNTDNTKKLAFEVSGVTTGTTRTLTVPNASGTIALTSDLTSGYQPLDSDLTAVAGLAANGLIARTGTGTMAVRAVTQPAAGITVTNGDGVSGNPTLALANDLAAVEAIATTGFVRRTASDTWSASALVDADIPGALTGKTYNGLTLTANATGFSAAGGTTSKTLTVNKTLTLDGTDGTTITFPATSGTLPLNNQTFFIGTTSVAINRASASLSLTGVNIDGSAGTATSATSATTATNLASGVLGSVPYQSAAGTTALLGPNTTTTKSFLRMTGTGAAGAAPAWDTVTKSDVGLSVVENTALSTWAGTTNITTLGTVATGTWNATAIGINKGGTGQTTAVAAFDALAPTTTLGDLIYYDGADNVRLAGNTTTNRRFLRQTGTGTVSAAPAWDGLVDGDIPSALTGKTYNALTLTAAATGFTIAGGTTSKTLTMSNTLTFAGTDGSTLNVGAGGTLGSAAFTASTAYAPTAGSASITTVGTIGSGTWQGSTIGISYGGTGATTKTAAFDALSPLTTLGDLIYSDGVDNVRLAGNTTTSKRFLTQTGTGTVSAAPGWNAIVDGDIPSALTGKTYNGLTLTANATGFQVAGGTTSKTLVISNNLTFSGTDGSTLNIGSGGTLGTGAYATIANYAPLASPTFTGTPAAPTAAVDTNTTQLATTAYVIGQGYLKSATAASTYLTSATAASTYVALSQLSTNGGASKVVQLDSSGRMGLGVTPSSWGGSTPLEIGALGNAIYSQPNSIYLSLNAYNNGGWKYGATAAAALYAQETGAHRWAIAASGTVGTAITFTDAMTLDASGNLTLGATSARIKGDFSNATASNRVSFQSSTTNGTTVVGAIPNGTSTASAWRAFNGSDPNNAALASLYIDTTAAVVSSDKVGTGSYVPLYVSVGGSNRAIFGASGGADVLTGFREARVAMGANDIDTRSGNFFTKTISGTTTLTVSNVPSAGTTASFILELTNGGSATINWWSGMKWAGGTAPTLTASGVDILGFYTHDGGTTWRGLLLAKDSK